MFKCLEENMRINIYDLGLGKDFIKEKQKRMDYKEKDKYI